MANNKKAIIIVNVGTPDKPEVKHVRRYLTEFLNDRRVIDLPLLLQKFLVNCIIIPFRVKNSTKLYKTLWTNNGSPLLYYMNKLVEKLQNYSKDEYDIYGAMRYRKPSLKAALARIRMKNYDEIVIFPLFPQYASSTSGTISQFVMDKIGKWNVIPSVKFINQFYDHPAFKEAFANQIGKYNPGEYDHILFSYHGLPNRHLNKVHPEIKCDDCNCDKEFPAHGKYCYRATCYATTRALVEKLNLSEDKYSTSFQSRLSNNWMTPFTDKTLIEKAKSGCKKMLVTAPAFVADCLETTIEIGVEYGDLYLEEGGEKLTMVESLNDSEEWAKAIYKIVQDY